MVNKPVRASNPGFVEIQEYLQNKTQQFKILLHWYKILK